MQNQNHPRNSNIELGSRSSNSQQNRPPISSSRPRRSDYLPQRDEDSPPEVQGQPQNLDPEPSLSLCAKFCKDKMINITIILMLCLYIIELAPICYGFYFLVGKSDNVTLKKSSKPKSLPFMKAELNADPIMDIQIMEKGSACPSGFEILKLGVWPGTVNGCLCENGDLYGTSCDKVDAEKCEKDVPSTRPREIYEWKESIWCVKRAVLETDYIKKAECPTGYKECYHGGCFAKDCPITKIDIGSKAPLVLAKVPGELPIINIRMTFGDIPCFTQDLFNQTIKNFTYELSAIQENSCDKYGLDGQFTVQLDSQTVYDSFTQNYFPSSVMHLPYFEGNATGTLSILSSKVRMKTAKHDFCLDIDESYINEYIEATWSFGLIFMCLIFILFLRIFCAAVIISSAFGRSRTEFFSNLASTIICSRFTDIITFILMLLNLLAFRRGFQAFQGMKAEFQRYESLECFTGGQGSLVVSDFLETVMGLETGFWALWALVALNGLYILIHTLIFIGKKISSRFSA